MMSTHHLDRADFTGAERVLVESGALRATLFRYPTGVEAVRLANARGHVIVLPYLGQMVWAARFDGVDLAMGSMFDMPRSADNIVGTYGCLAFHSGLLRNGCPGPQDDHGLHGEMPVAPMDSAALELGPHGLRLVGRYEYVQGFGDHYLARPSVTLAPDGGLFEIAMAVENRGRTMDLMYMCHVNFGFVPDGRIIQPAPFTPHHLAVRTAIPAHVPSSPAYVALLADLARDPARSEVLAPDLPLFPEIVFYLRGLGVGQDGRTHLMLRRPHGDGFAIAYDPKDLPHTVRWLMRDEDHQVAAFALPATCEPEGYLAERAKGHVRSLPRGAAARFAVQLGYVNAQEAEALAARIAAMAPSA